MWFRTPWRTRRKATQRLATERGGGRRDSSWFNIACYQAVPNGAVRPGNAARYSIIGPGYFNWDASVLKNFNLSKEGRWKAQLRAEASNALNWVNPSGVTELPHSSTQFSQVTSFRCRPPHDPAPED